MLGVTREEMALFPSYEVEGVPYPDKLSADLASQCASMFNQLLRVDISAETLDDKVVIVVFVPEASPQDKPIHFKATGLPKGAFRRIGSSDQRCTEDDLAIFYQSRQQESFDAGLHFLGEDDIRWLARFKDLHLSNDEARALVVAREAGAIDNATYRALNKVDALNASATLRRLRDAGLLSQHGRGSATWYQPTERLIEEETTGQDSRPEPLPGKSGALSSMSGLLSSKLEPLSSKLQADRNVLLDQLPGQLAARLGAIGLRHPPEQVRELIVELCQFRYWQAEELALLLQRKPETIRQDYLRPLLAQQRIAMTIPDKPKSPQQAYRSVRGGEE